MSNCVFIFNIQLLYFPRFQGVQNLRQGALCPPVRPQRKNVVPEASTLLCLMTILISTFQLLYSQIYTRKPYAPWTPTSEEILLPKASTSQYLIMFLISTFQVQQFPRFQGVPNLRQGALCPPVRLQRKNVVPEASTLLCRMTFLISTFYLLYFQRYQGSRIYTRGLRPLDAPQRRNFCTQSEYFTMSNCVVNFNILALVVSELLGGPTFT